MKHFILPFARRREQTQTKVWGDGVERERVVGEVRAINTKRPRQQLSSRAKISKVEERRGDGEKEWERMGERAASSPMATLLLAA